MSAFVDTGVFVAFANVKDRDHAAAEELVDRIRRGELGVPYTSDYVFDEVVTTALSRTGNPDLAVRAGSLILGSPESSVKPLARLLRVDAAAFSDAWAAFRSKRSRGLSFTDQTTVALMRQAGIDSLVSFDSGFDGIVRRVS
jgi:hypothetical protein